MRMKIRGPQTSGWIALAFMLLAAVVTIPTTADALSTAQGTIIENRATVNYDAGGVGQTPVEAKAFVTVTLVQAAPSVAINTVSSNTINEGQSTTVNYYVSANSNGPELYTFGSGSAIVSNMSAAGTGGATTPLTFNLGATTLAATTLGGVTIKVPYNPTDPAGSVNGITDGDTIMIGGLPYIVAAAGIDKTNATVWGDANYNMVTITLTTAVTAGTAAGNVVGERTNFSVTYTSGTVSVGQPFGTFNEYGTATAPGGTTGTSANTLITVNKPSLAVAKEVSVNGGTSYSASGNAAPGVSLIYRITITNNGGGNATSVRVTDALPPYLTYVAGASKYATSVGTYAAATALTEGAGGFTFVGNTLTYNPGGVIGTVAPAGVLVLFYRCTINN